MGQKHALVLNGRKLNVELANQRAPLKSRGEGTPRQHASRRLAAHAQLRHAHAGRKREENAPPVTGDVDPDSAEPTRKRELSAARPAVNPAHKRLRVEAPGGAVTRPSREPAAAPEAARTVVVGGLALARHPGVQLDAAVAVARTVGDVSAITFPAPAEQAAALLQDGCPNNVAFIVFSTLAAAQAAVAQLHGERFPAAGSTDVTTLWARQLGGEGAQIRRWRLIVRNVAFSVSDATLRQLFCSVGFVWDVHLPKQETGRARGFAFVAYTCRAHAERAIASLNGAVLAGRAIAVDWALSKRHYDAHQQPVDDTGAEPACEASAGPLQHLRKNASAAASDEGAFMSHVLAGVINVDQAEERCTGEKPPAPTRVRKREILSSRASVGSDPSHSATVFAHNLSPEMSARDLQLALCAYGRASACRLVVDKITGRPKGTAFVEFADADAAAAAIAAASASKGVAVCGRQVQLAAPVSKDEARALGAGKADDGGAGRDRRNLYLAQEGEVLEGSPAAAGVSSADMEKRRRAAEEKAAKLQNPNFSVSRTRLHVRNLPVDLDEKARRSLFINHVVERTGRRPEVKRARLLRDTSRLDGAGQSRSRGMGFVDFVKHQDALAALRVVNNNPTIFGKERRPIVEFALEDARAARKHELNVKLRARLKSAGADAGTPEAGASRLRAGARRA